MTKQEQFLFIVQTAMLANGINLSSRADWRKKYPHEFSASGVLGMLDDAIYASDRIPDNMTAYEAACDFCDSILEQPGVTKADVPKWSARDQ